MGKLTDQEQVLLFGASVEKYRKKADAYQATIKTVAALPLHLSLSEYVYETRVNFISDSSLWSAAFIYGIQLLLRKMYSGYSGHACEKEPQQLI